MRVGVCMYVCGCVGGGDMVYGCGCEGGQDENSDYTCASYIATVYFTANFCNKYYSL